MKDLKNYIGLIAVALFAIMLGCGGGGGGGGGGSSATATAGGGTDGFTSGQTDAGAGSTIIGRVVYQSTGSVVPVPEPGLRVEFYNSSNVVVGTATSRSNGYFDANIPTTAVKWRIDPDSVLEYNEAHDGFPSGGEVVLPQFQNAFRYNSGNYFSSLSTCYTSLPPITPGVLTPMPGGSAKMYLNSDLPPGLPGACIP